MIIYFYSDLYLDGDQVPFYPLALVHGAVDGGDEGLHLAPGQTELLLQRGQRRPANTRRVSQSGHILMHALGFK